MGKGDMLLVIWKQAQLEALEQQMAQHKVMTHRSQAPLWPEQAMKLLTGCAVSLVADQSAICCYHLLLALSFADACLLPYPAF